MTVDFKYQNFRVHLTGHNDHIMKVIRRNKAFYEQPMLSYIQDNIPVGCYIDAGANIGNHTIFFGLFCRAQVRAFEPASENLSYFIDNVIANGQEDRVRVQKVLLSDTIGDNYHLGGYDKNNMGMIKGRPGGSLRSNTIDNMCRNENNITLIKIDCEGMENKILRGAQGIIYRHRPHIFVEGNKDKLTKFFNKYNYTFVKRFNHTPTYYFRP